MSYTKETIGNYTVISFQATKLTLTTAAVFKEEIIALIDGGEKNLIADLNGVSYCDSSYIGAFVAVLKKATEAGGSLKLCALSTTIMATLKITRLEKRFAIFENREQALAS